MLPGLATATPFNVNLLSNPGAEDSMYTGGNVDLEPTGWMEFPGDGAMTVGAYGEPGFPTLAQAPPNSGTNFFWGGEGLGGEPGSQISQTLELTSDLFPAIDTPIAGSEISFELAGQLGGFGDDPDNMTLLVLFYNANLFPIAGPLSGGVELGAVLPSDRGNQTGFIFKSSNDVLDPDERQVPVGTRFIEVRLIAADGDFDGDANAYGDNICFGLNVETCAFDVPEPATASLLGLGVLGLGLAALGRR